ncbi:polysaccharide biosynthesis/export protein [Paraglaciecola psychrophila 170]|uniref:Polysaccharide biosynthesis/export protein n=1 Tax=Paraglaciecola psychrophila 170 TaxID=1129794 RepID=M4RSB8_9ALTE|nr:hypothetical protein [Paraglaciecola psychrophila]AGH45548.1 polysaccharide biosynthesis/export protein [Paraglaciecola psychrophila 170]
MVPGSHFVGVDDGRETATLEQDLSNVRISVIDSGLIAQLKEQSQAQTQNQKTRQL